MERDSLFAKILAAVLSSKLHESQSMFRHGWGATSTSLTSGQIVSMRKKNNWGRIIKRLKGTLGKRYKRH